MSSPPRPLPFYEPAVAGVWSSLAARVALVALAFSLAVTALMIWAYGADLRSNPLVDSQVIKLKAELEQHPEEEALKTRIREADQQIRRAFFDRRVLLLRGGYLLLGGLSVLILALKFRARLTRRPPNPLVDLPAVGAAPASAWMTARRAIGAAALVMAGGLGAVALMPRPGFTVASAETAPPVAVVWPSSQEFTRNWPWFRGTAAGLAPFEPPEWDGAAGKNVLWKAPVPLPGHSSPVVWKDRVFLSGATAKKREVYCYNADTGALLWQKEIPSTAKTPEVLEDTGFAPNTLATDGQRVYAIFPTGDVAALDYSGKILWTKALGVPINTYGHSSSLLCVQGKLLVQFDQAGDTDNKSALLALDVASGRQVWKTPRPVGASWSSPILIRVKDQDQVVTAAKPWVIAYDPAEGKEIWRASCLDGDIGPSPAAAEGMVFVANQGAKLSAIRTDGQGDVTATHIVWSQEDGMPDTVSPLATAELVFLTASSGTVTCYDARDGKKQWEQELDASFFSSPVLAGKTVYLSDRTGVTHRFAADRKYQKLDSYPLGEPVNASPAFVAGKTFIRGGSNLFCIGKK